LLAGSPLAPTGPVISPEERQETPSTDVAARAFLPAARTRTRKRKKNGKLLISSVAALVAVAAGSYLAVSSSARPAASQRTDPAQGTGAGLSDGTGPAKGTAAAGTAE